MTISNLSAFDAWRARLALTLIGLAWVLPFQSPNFFEPISSFYGEAAAVVLGLAAVTCLYGRFAWPVIQLPRSSLVFLGFAALILLHVALGRTVYPQQNLLAILYLIWAMALASLAWRLREIFGLERLVTVLSWFTLAGALVSAAIGLGQLWGISSLLQPFMLPPVTGRIYANTGQPNHLANYLCMGIASLIFLYGSARVRLAIALVVTMPLLIVLMVSGSRSIWLFLAALVILAGLHRVLRPSPGASRILLLSIAAFAGFLLAQWFAGILVDTSSTSVQAVGARMRSEGMLSPVRFRLWQEAWLMFCDAPLFGQGFRQFPWQHFLLNGQLPPPRAEDVINDNAHNLLLHTMAEFGVAGVAVLLAGIALWLRSVLRNEFSASMWWVLSLAAILSIHSMLEYPLWYAYFLGTAAVVSGASESAATTIGKRTGGRMVPVLVLLLGWIAVANIYQDYRTLQSVHRVPQRDAAAQTRSPAAVLLELQQHSLFAPFVELALARTIVLDREQIESKFTLNDAVMHFAPAPDVVYRQAVLLALDGQEDAARTQWDLAVANYPGERARIAKVLENVASRESNAVGLAAYVKMQRVKETK
ncbi:MAG: O-antigen ligase C-terminal domain-containing protein [Betaproteobacteria bacterium]|nr:O-antigen ligase C-terminal domain-containing protein [Betaproteobacteria bacterium]